MPHGRDGAIATLKDSLVRRFGSSLKDVVEAQVEGRLAGRERIDREDVDAIERSIIAARRQQRGAGHSRSAPDLHSVPPSAGSVQAQGSPAPPATGLSAARAPTSATPVSNYHRTSPCLARPLKTSHSDTKMAVPPYGTVFAEVRDDVSERSRVQLVPKYAVPLRPKLKPMDHWDLLVAYDAERHRKDLEAWQKVDKGAGQRRFKAVLDGQMEEVQAQRDEAANRKRQDHENMKAKIEENKRLTQEEEDVVKMKRNKVIQANEEMTESIQQRRQKAHEKKMREQAQMLNWVASEKARKDEEELLTRQEYARKCKQARAELEAARAEAARRKKAEQDRDRAIAVGQVKAMDQAEANNRAAVKARVDQIERNCETLGAEIADRDAKAERALQEKIRRVQEEADRASKEDAERRFRENKQRVDDMLKTLGEQVQEREEAGLIDKEANRRQAEVWRQEVEEGKRKDRAEAARVRRERESLDAALIEQIREAASVHPKNFGMTLQTQTEDLAFNRVLFEQMSSDGYRPDVIDKMLTHTNARGKLDPFPSVGRYQGPIHPLELAGEQL